VALNGYRCRFSQYHLAAEIMRSRQYEDEAARETPEAQLGTTPRRYPSREEKKKI